MEPASGERYELVGTEDLSQPPVEALAVYGSDLSITYSGARVDDTSLSLLRDARRVPKDEILYDEVDRVRREYEHRFILSSLREAAVTFTAVAMASFPVGDRAQR